MNWSMLRFIYKYQTVFKDKERLSICDQEPDIVLPRNLTDFSEIGGIEYLFFFITTGNTFSFKIFLFSNTKFLDLKGFTDIRANDKAMHDPKGLESLAERDIRKRSFMNAFTDGNKRDCKLELSVPIRVVIPARNNFMETIQPVKIPLKCLCQLDGAVGENDLSQKPP